jgi:hypothetical protein
MKLKFIVAIIVITVFYAFHLLNLILEITLVHRFNLIQLHQRSFLGGTRFIANTKAGLATNDCV